MHGSIVDSTNAAQPVRVAAALDDAAAWRSALLDRLHAALVLLTVPTFALIKLERGLPGVDTFEAITFALFTAIGLVFAARDKLTLRARARWITGLVLIVASYFTWNAGFTSGVVLLHVLAGSIAALCLGSRASMAVLAYSILSSWIMNASISGLGHPPPLIAMMDESAFLVWTRMTLVFSVLASVIVASLAFAVGRVDRLTSAQAGTIAQLEREIGRRRQAEAERERAHAELLRAQKAETVSMLAASLAHDLNNALTLILASSALVRSGVQHSEQALDDLATIDRAARSATGLTRSLLVLGKRMPMTKQPLRLDHFVKEAARAFERTLPEGIALHLDLRDVPLVLGDPSQLDHALLNLVFNARDAMPDGGQLHVSTFAGKPAHDAGAAAAWIALQVRDTGTGIDAQVRARLFEPFVSTKGERGTGLGLASVHAVVHELGGTIDVDSEPGRGTAFTLWFPVHAA